MRIEPCAKIFRIKNANNTFGEHLLLHRHQTDAIAIAQRGESYVLTTGTGSSKSLAYFIPVFPTVVTETELYQGLLSMPSNEYASELSADLDRMLDTGFSNRVLPSDSDAVYAACTCARRAEERHGIGRPASQVGGQITAILVSCRRALATRVPTVFEGIGVDVVNPWAGS